MALKDKEIPFSGAVTLIVSIFTFVFFYYDTFPSEFFVVRVFGLTTIYILLALVTKEMKELLRTTIEQVWDINKTSGLTPSERKLIIINFLGIAVSHWTKFWRMFQEIVNEKTDLKTTLNKLKNLLDKFLKGGINIGQALWIFLYLSYSVLISANFFQLPAPIDFLVNIAFFLAMLFQSGSIKGIGEFMFDIFTTLRPVDEKYVKSQLTTLENVIGTGSKSYYFFDLKEEGLTKESSSD